MVATRENVRFENNYPERGGKIIVQDIIFDGKVVGALVHEQCGLLEPVKMYIQVNSHESDVKLFDRFVFSEDEGRIYGIFEFDNFDRYLDYLNLFN